jgi:glycosyltransferase involved in cell wall biosynthesis
MKYNKKNILFILAGFGLGGIERHLVKQMRTFDTKKYSLHLAVLYQKPEEPELYDDLPSHVTVHKLHITRFYSPFYLQKLYKTIQNVAPHIVVTSTFTPNTMAAMLKPFFNYRLITREHNVYSSIKTTKHHIIDHFLTYFADRVVCVSQMVADYEQKKRWGHKKKFLVIHNGVEIPLCTISQTEARDLLKKEFDIKPSQNIILNVARLMPQKNQVLLIDSFELYHNKHPDSYLLILGEGHEREKLEKIIKEKKLQKHVFLCGSRSDVDVFYTAADISILTSDIEGFPNVAIESLAYGTPVVSTKVGGVVEYIQNGKQGYLVDRKKEDVAQGIENILQKVKENPEKMRYSCINTARQFTIEKNVNKYLKLFDHLL